MDFLYNTVFFDPLRKFVARVFHLLPHFLTFFIILVLGVVVAGVVRYATRLFFRLIQFDRISYKTGLTSILAKGGIKKTPSELFAFAFGWAVILLSLIIGLSVLEMITIENILSRAAGYFVNCVAAIIIFIAGYTLAVFLGRAVLIAAVNAHMPGARWISGAVQFFIIVFSLELGLEQLYIARGIVVATFSIIFGGIVLALSLAFGIGGKDIAKQMLEKWIKKEPGKEEGPDEFSHL